MDSYWHLDEPDFFEEMPAEKQDFMSLATRREVKRNGFIFIEGDAGNHCYYLDSGFVKIFRATTIGKEPIFSVRKAGELFGIAEVVNSSKERLCSAQSLSRSVVYEIKRADFETLLDRHPVLARKVIRILGRRLRYLCEQMENLMVCDVTSRLARLLIYIGFHSVMDSMSRETPTTFSLGLTQEEIAAMTGSCQQTISETLKRLQEEGLIQMSKKEITILNPSEMFRRTYH